MTTLETIMIFLMLVSIAIMIGMLEYISKIKKDKKEINIDETKIPPFKITQHPIRKFTFRTNISHIEAYVQGMSLSKEKLEEYRDIEMSKSLANHILENKKSFLKIETIKEVLEESMYGVELERTYLEATMFVVDLQEQEDKEIQKPKQDGKSK